MSELLKRRHILLANMGANKPRDTTYQLDQDQCASQFSAIALWKLLPEERRPGEILYLLTPEAAAASKEQIIAEASEADVAVRFIDLPGNEVPDDSREFLERVAEEIPEGCQLTLDVTQGLRHHAFLFYALALYLGTFRDVEIAGAWYCRWEISREESVARPFIDLKPVLDLAYWFHAIAMFRETGSLRQIASRMREGDLRTLADQLSFFFLNGMPLEAGNVAFRLVSRASEEPMITDIPLADQLHQVLLREIRPLAGCQFEPNPRDQQASKKRMPLTEDELDRQAHFIDRYFQTGQLNLAFGLLREWLVNRLAMQFGVMPWLDRQNRESIEHRLGGLGEVIRAKDPTDPSKKRYRHQAIRELLTGDQKDWGKRWNRVADIRNALQHHGMKPAAFEPHRADIEAARKEWEQRAGWPELSHFGGGRGKLLICPIGLTPGVLYSAIARTTPHRVVVVCSEQSGEWIDEAVAQAKASVSGELQVELMRLQMRDIHRGVGEFHDLVNTAAQWLYDADEIAACLTGGTTLMGVLVTRLADRASREYQRPVRQFVLIDSRLPEQQRDDPWQLGDIHYLDDNMGFVTCAE